MIKYMATKRDAASNSSHKRLRAAYEYSSQILLLDMYIVLTMQSSRFPLIVTKLK